ncbi:acetoacetyl-CoA synthetase [Caballeronia hypogeia]|uniref:Acetoacetyl-CoA synthetase n=1 Tax=Caballeronia hypogeia TaxID=1777140 RepID=A0A158C6N1_9BURK|nr:thioesterase domain-containing protein [Caballeronia hypogeia]SAK77950.1 acetoacetyl-CoA synthetase [Caballeronia hypogeia]
MSRFTAALEARTGARFADYPALHAFSTAEYRQFWRAFLESAEGFEWSGSIEPVCESDDCERAVFFPRVELNYAETLLGSALASDDMPALTCLHDDGRRIAYTRGELRERVMRAAQALDAIGLRAGDGVVAILRNDGDAVTVALAVAALGATLFTAASENSVQTLIDRFAPLKPRMLIAHSMPRPHDTGGSVTAAAAEVVDALPSVTDVLYLDDTALPSTITQRQHELREVIADGDASRFTWSRFAFNHPLFVTLAAGGSGSSDEKARAEHVVHGAGGVLIEHMKEHRLHVDLRPGDRLFLETSCSSATWQWQLSALASGVELVTYDGALAAADTFWRIVADERVNVFGTTPAYLRLSEDAQLDPGRQSDLSALRTILSTGGVTHASQSSWVHSHVGPVELHCMSGDADIMGSFLLGRPALTVSVTHAGGTQCKSLGLDVRAHSPDARAATKGELVCAKPFPSRPLGFIGDEDGARFHRAYFAANSGMWTQGETIEVAPHGAVRLHGRSDGTLDVRGIRVSTDDVHRILGGIDAIQQAMAVPRASANSGKEEETGIALLLVLRPGAQFDMPLAARIRRELSRQGSGALVPDVIVPVRALPVTHDGQLSESAARDAVNGQPARHAGSIRNPECLDEIAAHPSFAHATRALPAPGKSVVQIETYLRALWERLFGTAPIGRDDNFFELGGHSLLTARMLADIERATGRVLPLSTLTVAPTIARLAAVIAAGSDPDVRGSKLVHVRSGRGRPLFFVHSVTGSVMESLTLAHVMKSERPIYGIQADGFYDGGEPINNIEAMAQSYLQRVRAVQPKGPYALVGYSFGGLVVYEMAHQLVQAGEKVELVCLIDTYVNERCLPYGAWVKYQGLVMLQRYQKWRSLEGRERLTYFTSKAMAAADRIRMRLGKPARRPSSDTRGLPTALLQVRESARLAAITYKPPYYDGSRVILVLANIRGEGRANPEPAWRRFSTRGFEVLGLECRHNDLLFEPNVESIAKRIEREIADE